MADETQRAEEVLAEIGNYLRIAREAQGLTVQEVAARTRINVAFLQQIEQGATENLPGAAFVKGFIRNYMQVLELSDPDLEAALENFGPAGRTTPTAQLTPAQARVLEGDAARPPYLKIAAYVAVAALILWVGVMVFQRSDDEQPTAQQDAPVEAPATPADDATPVEAAATPADDTTPAEQTAAVTPPATPAAEAPAPPAATPPASPSGAPLEGRQKLELTIRGLEPTWVRLSIDRAPPIDVLMHPAETVGWEANQEIRLTVGKSHGVAVYLNGEEILLPPESNRLIPNLVLNKLTLLRLEN